MSEPRVSVPIVRRADGSPRVILPLRTWLLGTHLAVFFLPILVLVGSGAFARDLRQQTRADLEHQAVLLEMLAADLVVHAREHQPDAGLADVGELLSARLRKTRDANLSGIQAVDPTGVVVASSGETQGADLSDQREVRKALAGAKGVAVKPRVPARLPLSGPSRRARVRLFVAVPVEVDGEVIGALVLSRTPREELQTLYQMAPGSLLVGALAALALTLGSGLWMGLLLSRSLGIVARGTTRISEGRFDGVSALRLPQQSHVREVGQLAASVVAMADRLEERLGYISEFASNVSHEFKTPLSTLRGTVELLADDDGSMPPAQRQRFLENAEAELDRLQRLVDGLLSLARAEEGAPTEPVDLDALIADSVARYPAVGVSGRSGTVRASRSQLAAVLDNLLANAHRYGAPPVEVVAVAQGPTVGFDVCDAGPGISAANQAHVFDRFFTTGRDSGGTGLGLALVRAVVEAHGGTIEVRSEPGRTVFSVRLPAA